ncbi:hypothetical protein AB0C52_10960 [Streptomyces sp. NPDC048717]|uniref:hypothetical protein n=1 Tax=Streptomyces sp. NPDC048717 TaxID=3154928 RepID=UPI003430DFE9
MPGPIHEREQPREILGRALDELLEAALGKPYGPSGARALAGGLLHHGTLQSWLSGRTAPTARNEAVFWALVHGAEVKAGRGPQDQKWEALLRAAQGQSAQKLSARGRRPWAETLRALAPSGELDGRESEMDTMDAFVAASESESAYLCWHSKLAAGKTSLIAAYAAKRRRKVDLVHIFVSEAHGTHTRAAFLDQLTGQIDDLFTPKNANPGSREVAQALKEPTGKEVDDWEKWGEYLNLAAERSKGKKRRFLLVIDGLDEDTAWDVTDGAEESVKRQGRGEPGSIAALLPIDPGPNLRIIVSVRRPVGMPADIPAEHPLRQQDCFRPLGPGARAADIEQAASEAAERLLAHPLGRRVLGLLAVSGGGLRMADLAELAGSSPQQVGGIVHGPDGRCIVLDDPSSATYSLSHPRLLASLRRQFTPEESAHHTTALRTWADDRLRRAAWPEGTSPYLLTGHVRLLDDDPAVLAEYVLDAPRLLRLASDTGADVALAQVDAASHADLTEPQVATAARQAASAALLTGWTHHVPPEAIALCVRLGDTERALTLARSGPDPSARAGRLAALSMEIGRVGGGEAVQVATEAALWAGRATRAAHGPGPGWDTSAALSAAARELRDAEQTEAAHILLQAADAGGAGGIETTATRASLLPKEERDSRLEALKDRARDLSMGGPRARAAAVGIWAAIAEVDEGHRGEAQNCIIELCQEAESEEELAFMEVLAVGALALIRRTSVAPRLVKTAAERLLAALRDPGNLSEADRAYLRRDVAPTLDRLSHTMKDAEIGWLALEPFRELLAEQGLAEGALGDNLAERGSANLDAAMGIRQARSVARDREVRSRKREERERRREGEEPGRSSLSPQGKRSRRQAPRGRIPSVTAPEPHDDSSGRLPHLALLDRATAALDAGNSFLARERMLSALAPVVRTRPSAMPGTPLPWVHPLVHALGVIGESDQAYALLDADSGPAHRARHLSALSLGCSQGGFTEAASRVAQEAARLVADGRDRGTQAVVAQALAYAGEAPDAARLAPAEARPAVAAGLVSLHPKVAAELAAPVIGSLGKRLREGSLTDPLPRVAELLLTGPDVRRPAPLLYEALREVATEVCLARQSVPHRTVVLLALLERLGIETGAPSLLDTGTDILRLRTAATPHFPTTEPAVLCAVEGDLAMARRLAEAAPSPDGRAAALASVAAYLAGVPTRLAPERRSADAIPRLCLALAHAAGDGTAPDMAAARAIVLELLADQEGWVRAIPLLPLLAPEALVPMAEAVRILGPAMEGPGEPMP